MPTTSHAGFGETTPVPGCCPHNGGATPSGAPLLYADLRTAHQGGANVGVVWHTTGCSNGTVTTAGCARRQRGAGQTRGGGVAPGGLQRMHAPRLQNHAIPHGARGCVIRSGPCGIEVEPKHFDAAPEAGAGWGSGYSSGVSERKDGRAGRSPYGSAHDLPAFQELSSQLKGMSLLTRVVAREQHQEIVAARRRIDDLANLVDEFYALLGERNWVFHDALPTTEVRELLDRSGIDADVAERALIELYRESELLGFWVNGLRHRSGFQQRHHQITRALAHYEAKEFDSCVLQLIVVMDGFVNDFEPGLRKGLAARDSDEMVAWDSVVGHHKGLSHALKAFHKTFKKRVDDEVFEVHRHGIVHGAVVSFDNAVVATKAWNILFAVGDWAAANERAAKPPEPPPTLRETAATLWRHANHENYRERFRASVAAIDDPGFEELEVVRRVRAFLEAWEKQRWAIVAEAFSTKTLGLRKNRGQQIEWVKSVYEFHPLEAFEISEVEFPQASVAVIRGEATIGEESGPVALRWIHWRPDETLAIPGDADAEWCIGVYPPHAFFHDENQD